MQTLPQTYQRLYHSEYLKKRIMDEGMWELIPGVDSNIRSRSGSHRMKLNAPLFSFIDHFFPEGPFAFEPNMRDGRFVFLPDRVNHQGFGISASLFYPGWLDIGHFWYPNEYTEAELATHAGQIWVQVMHCLPDNEQLADMVQRWYFDQTPGLYCAFPFTSDIVIRLDGYFMDDVPRAAETIRAALKDEEETVRKNGEGLIRLMNQLTGGD